MRTDDGEIVYHDWHYQERAGEEFYCLAECYRAKVSGELRKLNPPEKLTWFLRLLVDTGTVEGAKVDAADPPADLSASVLKVYQRFLHLFECKWLYEPGAATAFTYDFAAAWCGVCRNTAADAMKELRARGLIQCVGDMKVRGHTMNLYLPGVTADRHDFEGLGTRPDNPEPEPLEPADPAEILDVTPIVAAGDQVDDLIAVAATANPADPYAAANAKKAELWRKPYERLKREEVTVR